MEQLKFKPFELERLDNKSLSGTYDLSEEELKVKDGLLSSSPISYIIKGHVDEVITRINFSIKAIVKIIDAHDGLAKDIVIEDQEDYVISDDKDIPSDLLIENGFFDFKPELLALFYNSVPAKYFESYEIACPDGINIYQEEEYEEKKENTNSPFASLKDLDL